MPDAMPILMVAIQSDKRSLLELSEIAELTVKEQLQTIADVSSVSIWGEKRYSMRLWLDPPQDVGLRHHAHRCKECGRPRERRASLGQYRRKYDRTNHPHIGADDHCQRVQQPYHQRGPTTGSSASATSDVPNSELPISAVI